jgi:aldose 1-epimerase
MYLALVMQGFDRMRRSLWHAAVMRSGMLTMIVLAVVLVGLAFGWREHQLGQFGQLKRELKKKPLAQEAPAERPGGQDPIQLQRSQFASDNTPEFLSATLLPGRGMNTLQITAYLPQRGEVPLLVAPSLAEAASRMTGTGSDAAGGESLAAGGAIEVPWAGDISGTISGDGTSLTTMWHGHRLSLPIAGGAAAGAMASGGLLLKQASSSQTTNAMPDGGEAQASFHVGGFGGHWISQTEVTTTVELSSKAIEMTVLARNAGSEPEPMGIGWRPRFSILSGDRGRETLRLPMAERLEVKDHHAGLPSGRLLPVEGTEYDFTAHNGRPLGSLTLADTFVHLRQGFMDAGPVAELHDPSSNYGLRITAMSSNIKALRVDAPAGANYVSIDPQFNYDDPFGREWAKEEDTGIVVLQPGQSVQWKIRLEIFSLSTDESQHM